MHRREKQNVYQLFSKKECMYVHRLLKKGLFKYDIKQYVTHNLFELTIFFEQILLSIKYLYSM